jgi:DNA-binding MarR family transcriptional regulator
VTGFIVSPLPAASAHPIPVLAFHQKYPGSSAQYRLRLHRFIAMILLWSQDDQTVGELGQNLFLQSNTLTPMLKRLEALGYIKRSRDSADERQVGINLTEAGRRLHQQASDIVRCVRDATGLREKQVKELTREVDALRTALESQRSR